MCSVECNSYLVQLVQWTFSRCECNGLWQWTRQYQIPPTVRCEVWFGFCRRKMLDPVKFTEDLLQSMANILWMRPVSENGKQCLGMGEQMFMTLRDQSDPLSSQTHWSKRCRENRHFTISEVYEQCPEVSRTVVYEIVTEYLQYRKICASWLPRYEVRGGNK